MAAKNLGGPWLSELLCDLVPLDPAADRVISGLSMDSRAVAPGHCFLACQGTLSHGAQYMEDAVRAGALAVVIETDAGYLDVRPFEIPVIPVPDLRSKVGLLADRFYSHPSGDLLVIGVTGTNGKTSVSELIGQALNKRITVGPCGIVGTLGNGLVSHLQPSEMTTPDAIAIHSLLADMRSHGAKSVVIEVSSHGLAQDRVSGVDFDIAVFTNLSRDHLDYHGSMAEYAKAKMRLFQQPGLTSAAINFDDPFGRKLLAALPAGVRVLGYTLTEAPLEAPLDTYPCIRASNLCMSESGLTLRITGPSDEVILTSPLLGRFNAANLLAAAATLLTAGVPLPAAVASLATVPGVPGRLEIFRGRMGRPMVVVDYAHTPDGLQQSLMALRELCTGRLWCVFGCGGERDRGKRPLMGQVAARIADRVVLTNDNPRREDADTIIQEILAGMSDCRRVEIIRDRGNAIATTITRGRDADIVLVAGKGHEDYQDIDGHRQPFSDRSVVRCLLANR